MASCAVLQGPPEQRVEARAKARYEALVARDYEKAHSFFTPSFRKSWTYREYLIMRPPVVQYRKAEVVSVKCDAQDSCSVGVNVSYTPTSDVRGAPRALEISRFNEEKWIRVDGDWWLYQAD